MWWAGASARLRAKQGLLATLLERARDANAYTRARVLQTWAHLAQGAAIPLGHWVAVTELAIGAPGAPGPLSYKLHIHQPRYWPTHPSCMQCYRNKVVVY